MAYQVNQKGGVYWRGKALDFTKRVQIIKDFIETQSTAVTARKNSVSYNTVTKIVEKFRATASCKAGVGGNPNQTKLHDYIGCYIECLLIIDPMLYLWEIQRLIQTHLNLMPNEVPSISSIHNFLKKNGLTRKKAVHTAVQRFTPLNLLRRQAYFSWRKTVNPQQIFFGDETGIEKSVLVVLIDRESKLASYS
jgi:hypothetical protein